MKRLIGLLLLTACAEGLQTTGSIAVSRSDLVVKNSSGTTAGYVLGPASTLAVGYAILLTSAQVGIVDGMDGAFIMEPVYFSAASCGGTAALSANYGSVSTARVVKDFTGNYWQVATRVVSAFSYNSYAIGGVTYNTQTSCTNGSGTTGSANAPHYLLTAISAPAQFGAAIAPVAQ